MVKVIIGMILGGAMALGGVQAKDAWEAAGAVVDAESKCVAQMVAQGIERIDIAVGNGKCWEEENGYYK